MTRDELPDIPVTCPPEMFSTLVVAKNTAEYAIRAVESAEKELRRLRDDARSKAIKYENLVLEVNGQGTLDLS